jgi:drug/metabolite transporter (DMT)-like permease
MTSNTKGILLAAGAAFSISNVYIFSKAALNQVHIAQFGFYWFGLGIIWNLIYFFAFGKYKKAKNMNAKNWWSLLLISFLEMFSTLFFFLAIKTVANPAVVSFLANINPLFVVGLGILVLKERFNRIEFLGMAITLAGAIIISVTDVSQVQNIFIEGTQYIVISGIIYSISTLVAKRQMKFLDASYLATSRLTLLFLFSLGSILFLDLPFTIDSSPFISIGIGSVLGPFFGGVLGYMSLKHIEMSKATMVRSIRSLFVIVGAYFYFESIPTEWQLFGGLLTMSGVVLISLGKLKLGQSRKK